MSEHIVPPQLEAMVPKTTPVDFGTPVDTSNLRGRSVLVTGGASGLGLGYVTAIAEAGAIVTIADLQDELGATVTQDLISKGHKVQYVHCDVTSYTSQVDTFKKAIPFGGGKIDIVVPNAGVIAQKNLTEMLPEGIPDLDSPPPEPGYSCADINLRGVYYSCYLALHYFRLPRQPDDTFKKAIVLIASLAGYIGYPSSTTYSLSKFGVRGLFYSIREAATKQDPPVRVNLVGPSFINTQMTQNKEFLESSGGMWTKLLGFAPIEDVVGAMVRLSADESVSGKSVCALPHGNFDLEEDIWGGYGGKVVQKHMGQMLLVAQERMKMMQAQVEKE